MARKFTEKKLVIASHNKGKIKEILELLEPFGVDVTGGTEFGLDEPEENGDTFLANALIKSIYFAEATNMASLADDSGLVVPALNGDPGIYSARWAGQSKDFSLAMKKVEEALIEKTGTAQNHDAYFVCALSLTWADGHSEQFEGKVFGKLSFPARGNNGFGYDPIFIPNGYDVVFAEMKADEKHKISHRADAFKQLVEALF